MTDAELLGRLLAGACEVDERLLAALLAEGVPAPVALRRAARGRWHAGVALLLGGALALGAAGPVAAREAPPAAHAAGVRAAPVAGAPAAAPAATLELAPAALGELALVPGTALILPAIEVNAEGVAAPAQQTPGAYYVVRAGDTLSAIALAAYGNAGLWRLIYDSNLSVIADANLIYPGQSLLIPQLNQVPVGVTPGLAPGAQTGQGLGQYTVVAGDSLSAIAQRAYGNGALWWVIYNANAGVIGANPSLILPGQVLGIPANPGAGAANPGTATPGGQTGRGAGPYTVRSGDSLWSIAQFAYGNPARWVDIYNANAAIIGADPGMIFSGTVLNLPA